jgi:GT2 family glycosyltransferase
VTTDLGVSIDVAAAAGPGPTPGAGGCGGVALTRDPGVEQAAVQQVPAAAVTAVLVARDGAAFLPRAVAALAAQTRQPAAVIAVDAGSRDGSGELLAVAVASVVVLERRCGLSAAIDAALAQAPAVAAADESWLWVVHDDCAPRPDALERLLAAVETAPSVALAGCKQVGWDDDQRILDVGITTTRGGARVSVADRHEVDQGQHDERSDVLAVSTAGMLVRRDLWERLGGADPALAHARDELDLGRRAHLAGHRVVVVPGAVVAHAGAWATGRRPGCPPWWRAERRDAVHLRLASVALPLLPFVLAWTALAALPRAVLQLALRRPARARDELAAVLAVWARPDRWIRSRWRARRVRVVPRGTLRSLYASRSQLIRARRDDVAAWIVPAGAGPRAEQEAAVRRAADPFASSDDTAALALLFGETGPHRSAGEACPVAGGEGAHPCGPGAQEVLPRRPPAPHDRLGRGPGVRGAGVRAAVPVILLTATAAVLGLPALFRTALFHGLLTGRTSLVAPDLLPAPSTARALWRSAQAAWRPSGLGAAAPGDPLTAVVAALSIPLGGVPGRVIDLVLLGALPLAACSAWLAVSAITPSRLVRSWVALVWAACPPLLAAVAAGRLGAVLAHVLLPVAALALARAAGLGRGRRSGRSGVHAGCAAGLLVTVVLASAPSLTVALVITILTVTGWGVVQARRGRALGAPSGPGASPGAVASTPSARSVLLTAAVPALTVPAVLLAPWWAAVAAAPRLLLADPGLPGSGSAAMARGSGWWNLLLLTGDPASGAGSGTPAGAAVAVARMLPALPVPHGSRAVAAALAAVLAGPVLGLALASLLRRPAALAAWVAALAGLATALAAVRVTVGATGLGLDPGQPAAALPGPGLSFFALGMLAAAAALLHRGRFMLRPARRARPGRVARAVTATATVAVAVVALAGPLAVLAGWSGQGLAGPGHGVTAAALPALRAVPPEVLPAVATDEAEGEAGARTLVVRADRAQVRWTLARAAGPRLGDDSAALAARRLDPGAATTETALVAPVLAALMGDGGQDVTASLADLGAGSVLLVGPVPQDAILALDASPGLVRVSQAGGSVLWRVELPPGAGGVTRPARARLLDASGRVLSPLPSQGPDAGAQIAAGQPGRVVRLAERADPGWRATLDGRPLAAVAGGWSQAFALPQTGGHLRVWHVSALPDVTGTLQIAVLAVTVLGLVPLPRLRRRVAAPSPPAPSRPVPRAGGGAVVPGDLPPMPRVFGADHPEDGVLAPLFADEARQGSLGDEPAAEADNEPAAEADNEPAAEADNEPAAGAERP